MKTEAHTTQVSLVVAALGVVFGDIGTSPLYAIREAFGHSGVPVNVLNVLGVLSLMIWSLILVVSLKYLVFVLKASNKGEGGVLALTALISSLKSTKKFNKAPLVLLGLFGAALLFGDGVITPAVTILGAIEGLNVATTFFEPYVVPIAILILMVVFWFQYHGTATIGAIFGPVIFIWFLSLGVLGVSGIVLAPQVLESINPYYALDFILHHGRESFLVLGAVFLAVTGAEALYADMGHFGAGPIRRAWYFIAFPGLLLNYLGQGALLLVQPQAAANPFFHLVPAWGVYPMVLLATLAAVIASQALITGVFSLTQQAIHLGYLPRLKIVHTSQSTMGQIYIPSVNWLLFGLTVWVVFSFKTSSNLAAAYGIAVSLTMLITTVLACTVAWKLWNWHPVFLGVGFVLMVIVDLIFLSANLLKIHHGGWFPLALGAIVFTVMTTWKRGRTILSDFIKSKTMPLDKFIEFVHAAPPARVPGTAVFMTADPTGLPIALVHNVKHNKNMHERNVFLTIVMEEVPHLRKTERLEIIDLGNEFYRVLARFGFMEQPDINDIIVILRRMKMPLEVEDTTFFVGRETIIAADNNKGMAVWRERLFGWMLKNSDSAIIFYNVPRGQVIELGMQVEF